MDRHTRKERNKKTDKSLFIFTSLLPKTIYDVITANPIESALVHGICVKTFFIHATQLPSGT